VAAQYSCADVLSVNCVGQYLFMNTHA
jgi:hypothetical protein